MKTKFKLNEHTANMHTNVSVCTVEHSEQNVTTSSVELSENLTNDHDKIYYYSFFLVLK